MSTSRHYSCARSPAERSSEKTAEIILSMKKDLDKYEKKIEEASKHPEGELAEDTWTLYHQSEALVDMMESIFKSI